jgi:hypothetical protein
MVRWAGGFRYFWGLFCNKPVEMLMISAGSGRTARGVPGEQPEGSPMAPNRFFPGPGFCLDFRPYDRGGGGLEGSPMAPNRIFSAGSFSKKACALLSRGVGVMRGRGADRRKAASGGATLIAVGSPILFSSVHSQVDVGPVSRPDPNGRCLEGSPMAPNRFFCREVSKKGCALLSSLNGRIQRNSEGNSLLSSCSFSPFQSASNFSRRHFFTSKAFKFTNVCFSPFTSLRASHFYSVLLEDELSCNRNKGG